MDFFQNFQELVEYLETKGLYVGDIQNFERKEYLSRLTITNKPPDGSKQKYVWVKTEDFGFAFGKACEGYPGSINSGDAKYEHYVNPTETKIAITKSYLEPFIKACHDYLG